MTATEAFPVTSTAPAALPFWQRAMVFGTGFGIVIAGRNLEVALVRARASGSKPIAAICIENFRTRPAAEWGAELSRFVTRAGEGRLAATVLLPREEVIVRVVHLPGVPDKDLASALELQIDSLHPFGDEEVAWGWSRVSRDAVLVGLARKSIVAGYETTFGEAGIPLAAVTFSAAVIHAALRLWNTPPAGLLVIVPGNSEGVRPQVELYGESESRPVYSAEFSMAPERALVVARAELRLSAEVTPLTLQEALASPDGSLVSAAALSGAVRSARFANLLPAERRSSHNRLPWVLPSVLAMVLIAGLVAVFVVMPALDQRRYLADLDREARRLEPAALRAQALEKQTLAARARLATLDDLRRRPQADLDLLNELTRLLPPQVWTNSIEIYPDSVVLAGEADQAAPLLKLLDASPLLQNSEFGLSVSRNGQTEQFRIKSMRRGRTGRTTP